MLVCNKCNVKVAGNPQRCPLCQGDLTGIAEPEGNVFPLIQPPSGSFKRLLSFIAFGTIAVAAISVAVNIALPVSGILWSLFIIAGLASLWLSFLVINRQWWDIPKIIFRQLMIISLLVLLWDFFNGFYKWSLNFVIPILFSCSMVALAVFAKVRRLKVEDYCLFLGFISVISIFSLLLVIFHVVTIIYPALVCFTLSIISLAFLLLFEGKSLWQELQRRMHL
ncbi:putative membrane protein [Treponema primitia ZAS-2]|uniref:Putative membrane protein n=1 Tax=Treponema primitia (strain ATCC BAA-887 / DSM 12427 / ZAS-2) TaxID=545694 RepID=F5YKD4_TREPZ|nr:DUF6320 domain-containing protein [Treponema primitia]AEF85501.1 putative membrane protein [Treponema primitia ZAS-2]